MKAALEEETPVSSADGEGETAAARKAAGAGIGGAAAAGGEAEAAAGTGGGRECAGGADAEASSVLHHSAKAPPTSAAAAVTDHCRSAAADGSAAAAVSESPQSSAPFCGVDAAAGTAAADKEDGEAGGRSSNGASSSSRDSTTRPTTESSQRGGTSSRAAGAAGSNRSRHLCAGNAAAAESETAAADAETGRGKTGRENAQQQQEEEDDAVASHVEEEEAEEADEDDLADVSADGYTAAATAEGETSSTAGAAAAVSGNFDLEKKLEELLRKTDTYSAKIHGGGAAAPSSAAAGGSSRSRRALSEKEEDDILLRRLEEEDEEGSRGGTRGNGEAALLGAAAGQRIGEQPACIEGKMKHYQIEGLNWLYQLHCLDINGILADEMGLGKTLQTISILAFLQFEKGIPGPHLVICPRSTLDNWFKEVNKWCPRFRPARLHGTKEERELLYETVLAKGQFDVCITTYEMVIKDYHRLASSRFKWNYLVMDEAHRIKNEKSVLSEVVRRFRSRRRLLITGTPLQNNLRELWALLNFIMPQLFDSTLNFEALFDFSRINTEQQQHQVITTLHRILRPFMLRRLKSDVARDLPPKREIYVFVGMSTLQKKLYADILSKNVEVLNAMSGNKTQMLNILMQLRKCCNHPYLFDGVEPGPPFVEGEHMVEAAGKMALLDKLLPRLKAEGSRVLLFSQMTRVLDILDDYCRWRGYDYCRIDGSTPGTERQERIDDFNAEGSKKFLFLLSTRAGGLGINLATADIVILFDSDFNPQMDLQAMDRAHRIGQKKKVVVYRFVTEATVEERIVERAAKKLKLDSLVIQKGRLGSGGAATSQRGPSTNELHDILQFGAQEVYRTQGESSITEADLDVILADAEQRTAEIQAQLTSLESKFDLSNISLDGGLHMYGAEDDESGSQPGKPGRKKTVKLNRPATFFELGDRKTKWRGEGGGMLAKKERKFTRRTLSGWRAEINGGYDFQFFNSEQLDYLDSVQRRWQAYLEDRKRKRLEELKEEQRAAAAAMAAAGEQQSSDSQPAAKKLKLEEDEQQQQLDGGAEGAEEGEMWGGQPSAAAADTQEVSKKQQREVQRLLEGLLDSSTEEAAEGEAHPRQQQQQEEEKEEEEKVKCEMAEETKTAATDKKHVKHEPAEEGKENGHRRAPGTVSLALENLTYKQLQQVKEVLVRFCSRTAAGEGGFALRIGGEAATAGGGCSSSEKEERQQETAAADAGQRSALQQLAEDLRRHLTPANAVDMEVEGDDTADVGAPKKCLFPHPAAASFRDALIRLATQLTNGEAAEAGVELAVRTLRKQQQEQQQQQVQSEDARRGGEEGSDERSSSSSSAAAAGGAAAAGSSSSSSSPGGGGPKKKAGRPRKAAAAAKDEGGVAGEEDQEDCAALLQLLQQEDLDDKNDPDRPQEFTEEMNKEKERLLAEGFGHWNRTEFTKFVSALIHYGKDRLEEAWVAYFRGTSKTLEDLQEYAEVFFKRYLEVDGGDRIMQRVEKAADIRGALDSQRRAVQSMVEEQLRSSLITRPQDLQLPARLSPSSVFTGDEDRMLLWGLYEQGINAYALVHAALKYYWFDTRGFFRIASRSVKQVEERCKEIVAAVEAELSEKTGCKEHTRMRQFRHSCHRIGRPPTRTGVAGGSGGYRSAAAAAAGATGARGSGSQLQPRALTLLGATADDCSNAKGNSSKSSSSSSSSSWDGSFGGRGGGGASALCKEENSGNNSSQVGTQKAQKGEGFASANNNTSRKEAAATREDEGQSSSKREIDGVRSRKGAEMGQESSRGGVGAGGSAGSEQRFRPCGGSRRRGRPRGGSSSANSSCRGGGVSSAASQGVTTGGGKRSSSEKFDAEVEVGEDVSAADTVGEPCLQPVRISEPNMPGETEARKATTVDNRCRTGGQDASKARLGESDVAEGKVNSAAEDTCEADEENTSQRKVASATTDGAPVQEGGDSKEKDAAGQCAVRKSTAEEARQPSPTVAVSQKEIADAD